MHPLARPRATAYLLDCIGYLGVAAAMVPVGIVVAATTDLGTSRAYSQLVSAVPPAIATVIAARAESGPRRATWGKRRRGLEVVAKGGGTPGFGAALLRNTAKIFLPWQLGHLTTIGAIWGAFDEGDPLTIGASIGCYALMAAYAWTVLRGSGRGIHDLLAGTTVVAVRETAGLSAPSTPSRSR